MEPNGDPGRPEEGRFASELRALLLAHYDRHRRDLPWRGQLDPYRVWISEVMLQQTRVETVIPYYRRWLERFPDLAALASADEDEVMRAWEGLGYYSRARNLLGAARLLRERHEGELPADPAALGALPGFGPYTVGAVASIAFGLPRPAVDGNARRVLCRLLDLPAPTARELEARAAQLVDPARPGDFNQAVMDLGATVCTPRAPRCAACPLGGICRARSQGTVAERPLPRTRREVPTREFVAALLVDGAHALLERRPPGLLGGMWAFPEQAVEPGESELGPSPGGQGAGWSDAPHGAAGAHTSAAVQTLGARGFEARPAAVLPPVLHAFTHLRACYRPVVLLPAPGRGAGAPHPTAARERRWVRVDAPGVALPAAQKRMMASLRAWLEESGSHLALTPGGNLL